MKEWKFRQQLYHSLESLDDIINPDEVVVRERETLVENIIQYFSSHQTELVYPAKSYAVAIIYARLLAKYFGEDFWKVLDDPDLLYGNDRFFVPFSKDPQVYEDAVSRIGWEVEHLPWDQVRTTVAYFKKEFQLV